MDDVERLLRATERTDTTVCPRCGGSGTANLHDPNQARWRTGRKVGRTIYMQLGPDPADHDVLIGLMDSPEIAAHAVEIHNAARDDPVCGKGQ